MSPFDTSHCSSSSLPPIEPGVLRAFYSDCSRLVDRQFAQALEPDLQAALVQIGADDNWSW